MYSMGLFIGYVAALWLWLWLKPVVTSEGMDLLIKLRTLQGKNNGSPRPLHFSLRVCFFFSTLRFVRSRKPTDHRPQLTPTPTRARKKYLHKWRVVSPPAVRERHRKEDATTILVIIEKKGVRYAI